MLAAPIWDAAPGHKEIKTETTKTSVQAVPEDVMPSSFWWHALRPRGIWDMGQEQTSTRQG